VRIMFTSLGGHGHFRPMAPLAQALRDAHHDVVVATMESLRSSVEDLGLEMLPVGIAYAEAMQRLNAAHPELQSLGPEEESRRVVTDLLSVYSLRPSSKRCPACSPGHRMLLCAKKGSSQGRSWRRRRACRGWIMAGGRCARRRW
jgi:hypothetical protein